MSVFSGVPLIRNVVIIENSVRVYIPVNRDTMLCEPVDDLDDLLYWEERMDHFKQDYVIAEFQYGARGAFEKDPDKRVYSIFTNKASRAVDEEKALKEKDLTGLLSLENLDVLENHWGFHLVPEEETESDFDHSVPM